MWPISQKLLILVNICSVLARVVNRLFRTKACQVLPVDHESQQSLPSSAFGHIHSCQSITSGSYGSDFLSCHLLHSYSTNWHLPRHYKLRCELELCRSRRYFSTLGPLQINRLISRLATGARQPSQTGRQQKDVEAGQKSEKAIVDDRLDFDSRQTNGDTIKKTVDTSPTDDLAPSGEKPTIWVRFREATKRYGKILLVVHIITSSFWAGGFYYAALK